MPPVEIPDSGINLVWGTLHSVSNITNSGKEKLDEVSIISTSSEELEPFNLEERDNMLAEFEANNLDDALGLDLPKLFLTLEPKL